MSRSVGAQLLRQGGQSPPGAVRPREFADRAYAYSLEAHKGRIAVKGTGGTSTQHTVNEDELRSFTDHINGVLGGDPDIGDRLPIPTDTMQLFDECRGEFLFCHAEGA